MTLFPRLPPGFTLTPICEDEIPVLQELAATIWRHAYTGMITVEQIEYMLGSRYTPERIRAYLDHDDRGLLLLKQAGGPIGYCSHAVGADSTEMKLEQLYLLERFRGRGLGSAMLGHVETLARQFGCRSVVLTVNKQNIAAIGFYRAAGFAVRHEAVFDIGGGFVMDDYVMEKRLREGRTAAGADSAT